MAKATEFRFYSPKAKKVILTGSFNKWNTRSISAKKDSSGNWTAKVDLPSGRHEYKFIVDGNWVNDPSCRNCVPNSLGSQNCVIEVR
jgi:1,4-alpha-glucan branching enzyme